MFLTPIQHALAARRIARTTHAPVVIGATGGSGTRVIHSVLETAGLFMGHDQKLNHAGDAMDIEPVLDAYINPILSATNTLDYETDDLPRELQVAAGRDLAIAVARFLSALPARQARWGWKNPRSMYILPLIHALFPEVRFIHLVRDGRDMATSDNQNQPRKHYQALFCEPLNETDPSGSIRLWAAANLAVADWAERNLGERYLRLRFEDLCAEPEDGVRRILEFAGFEDPEIQAALVTTGETVAAPSGLNRWRQLDLTIAETLTRQGAAALTRFGYPSVPTQG
ncbi:MAG: sulfotransferase [Proteobacteria bacterium]|nr:sulfotransferase [Pseudomonadota bacterium]MDA1310614.1 sulfotransferase [Pseudomonadota bacterium]